VEGQVQCKLKNPRFTNKQEHYPMNLLDTDPLKSLLEMRNTGVMPNTPAPDSDLMDVVLSGQPHETLFRGQMSVPTAAGGGGVTQDDLERAGLFSTVDSNPIAGLTGGSFKPFSGHSQALLDAAISRTMRAGPKHGGFYSDGDPMGAQDDVLPDYDDLSDTDSIKSTNIAHSVDDEDETKYDSDDPLPDVPPPRPFPNSKFERSDPRNFVFGDEDDEEERKKGYKKSLDADDVKNRKREMKTKRAQLKRQQAVQQRRAAADVTKEAWYKDAAARLNAERAGSTYMGQARRLVKGSKSSLAAGAKQADDEKAAAFTARQQTYEERASRAKRPDMAKETDEEEKKRGATRLKDRRRRKRDTCTTIERKRKQKVTTYARKKNLDEFGIVV
jgi:hypothetical protein